MIRTVVKKFRKWIFWYLFLGITSNFLICLNVIFFQKVIDSCQTILVLEKIYIYIAMYGVTLLIVNVLQYLQNYPDQYLENGITEQLKYMSLKKISQMDYREYQEIGTGKTVQIIENGSVAGTNIIFSFYLRIFSDLLPSIVFSLLFIGTLNIKIMLALSFSYIFVFLISRLLMKKLYEYKEKLLNKQEEKSNYSIRSFMEFVTFRLNKQYQCEMEKIKESAKEIVNTECKIIMTHEAFFSIFEFMVTVIKTVLLFIGIGNIVLGNTTIGILVALISFVDKVYSPIAIFNVLYVQYKLNKFSYTRLIEFIGKKDDKNLYYGKKVESSITKIEISNLDYTYNGAGGFSKLNLVFSKDQTVALVGESGSGKSTLVKLICGLLKKQKGLLLINGIDIDSIELDSYYDHVTYLSQETPVFDGTIRENIVFQREVDDEEIYEYLKEVNLYEKVKSLEKQLDTRIGERGIQLSGGERQRLALARVMAQKRELIILDEATSALDIVNEQIVLENIAKNMRESIIITIAHRIQSVRNADKIIVFKNFQIEDIGTFDELIKRSAYFRRLWDREVEKNGEYLDENNRAI